MSEEKVNQMNKEIQTAHDRLVMELNGSDGRKSEPILYHYTNLESGKSILLNSELWMTDVRYFNDPRELEEGLDIYNRISDECLKEFKEKDQKFYSGMSLIRLHVNLHLCPEHKNDEIVKTYGSFFEGKPISDLSAFFRKGAIYIASLSEKSDMLRQWIPYSSNGNGVAIGFDGLDQFHNITTEENIYICAASYESIEKKEKFVRDLYYTLYEIFQNFVVAEDPSNERGFFGHFAVYVFYLILVDIIVCKSETYQDEGEWRLIRYGDRNDFKDRVEFRVRDNYIVPYISVEINKTSIKNIVLGPRVNQGLTQMSLAQIKNKIGYDFKMTNSKVSYR